MTMQTIHSAIQRAITVGVIHVIALGVAIGVFVHAQSNPTTYSYALNQTTLSAAVADATTRTITITSASAQTGSSFGAVVAGQVLFVDLELMTINAVSGTTLTVTRGTSNAAAHASGAVVFIGPASMFKTTDPPIGACTAASVPAPWVNVQTGNAWLCRNSTWKGTNPMAITYNSVGTRVG